MLLAIKAANSNQKWPWSVGLQVNPGGGHPPLILQALRPGDNMSLHLPCDLFQSR
jgi:hypothetical protein